MITTRNNSSGRRRVVNTMMTTLTALCAFVGVALLVLILGYIAWRGLSSISIQFLIDTPKPVGEGGGIGNAILGTLILLALASAIGLPLGIASGVYLAEFGRGWFAGAVRFISDTAIVRAIATSPLAGPLSARSAAIR